MASRKLTPLIATQAITLLMATGASVAWTTTEIRSWHAQVDVPQRTLRDIEAHAQAAIIAPYDFLGTANTNAKTRANTASAEARASLRAKA